MKTYKSSKLAHWYILLAPHLSIALYFLFDRYAAWQIYLLIMIPLSLIVSAILEGDVNSAYDEGFKDGQNKR